MRYWKWCLLQGLFVICADLVGDPTSAQHSLNITIPQVSTMSVSGDIDFQYDILPAGYGFTSSTVCDYTCQYSVSSNIEGGQMIIGHMTGDLPPGFSIKARLYWPPGGSGNYGKVMTATDQVFVDYVPKGAFPDNQIVYCVSANQDDMENMYQFQVTMTYTLVSRS